MFLWVFSSSGSLLTGLMIGSSEEPGTSTGSSTMLTGSEFWATGSSCIGYSGISSC